MAGAEEAEAAAEVLGITTTSWTRGTNKVDTTTTGITVEVAVQYLEVGAVAASALVALMGSLSSRFVKSGASESGHPGCNVFRYVVIHE